MRVNHWLLIMMGLLSTNTHAQSMRIDVAPAESIAIHKSGASGSAIVIVPGLLGSHFGFRHVTQALESQHRVFVVDLLGFGSSSRPRHADYSFGKQSDRLNTVLEKLGIERATLVCHALAATPCYRAAAVSDRITGIVSINGVASDVARTSGVSAALRFAPILQLLGAEGIIRNKVKHGLRNASADPDWLTPAVLEAYLRPFHGDTKGVLTVLKRMNEARETYPLQPFLPRIRIPVELLVSNGTPSPGMKEHEMARVRQIAGVVVTLVPETGQYIHEEQPQAVITAIARLLNDRVTATQ